jgi:ubiquinone/menaquinone biosynthesis C-methylase UbiE
LLVVSPVRSQQTGLTTAQIASAERVVPALATLLELKPGMTVADVGAGFGAWTVQFVKALGPTGRVYANDIGAAQLSALREQVARDGLATVTVVEGAAGSSNLPEACCDAILVRDAYHHFTQASDMVKSLASALKSGGRLAIIDFPPRAGGHGVEPEVIEREVGAVLTHVSTTRDWSPQSQPASLFLVVFRKP